MLLVVFIPTYITQRGENWSYTFSKYFTLSKTFTLADLQYKTVSIWVFSCFCLIPIKWQTQIYSQFKSLLPKSVKLLKDLKGKHLYKILWWKPLPLTVAPVIQENVLQSVGRALESAVACTCLAAVWQSAAPLCFLSLHQVSGHFVLLEWIPKCHSGDHFLCKK